MIHPFPSEEFVCENIKFADDSISMNVSLMNSSNTIREYVYNYKNRSLYITLFTQLNWKSKVCSDIVICPLPNVSQALNKIYVRTSHFSKYELIWKRDN